MNETLVLVGIGLFACAMLLRHFIRPKKAGMGGDACGAHGCTGCPAANFDPSKKSH